MHKCVCFLVEVKVNLRLHRKPAMECAVDTMPGAIMGHRLAEADLINHTPLANELDSKF